MIYLFLGKAVCKGCSNKIHRLVFESITPCACLNYQFGFSVLCVNHEFDKYQPYIPCLIKFYDIQVKSVETSEVVNQFT